MPLKGTSSDPPQLVTKEESPSGRGDQLDLWGLTRVLWHSPVTRSLVNQSWALLRKPGASSGRGGSGESSDPREEGAAGGGNQGHSPPALDLDLNLTFLCGGVVKEENGFPQSIIQGIKRNRRLKLC